MDIKTFQRKLEEILTLAKTNGKRLSISLAEDFFAEDNLTKEQLDKVYAYLQSQGIALMGFEGNTEAALFEEEKAVPLLPEEEAYLEEYRRGLGDIGPISQEERMRLFFKAAEGERESKDRLVKLYQEEILTACREYKREGLLLGDMIQEGNLALLMALEEWTGYEDHHKRLCNAIREGLGQMASAHTGTRRRDQALVERVERLEEAVKTLTEDVGEKFSIEELSLFLDMEEDEIRDVLRLTGEE